MADTLASVLLLIISIALTLILPTALERFFHPSRQDVRNLLTALENLVLPMGSFPSKLLHPWASNELSDDSNSTASPLSTTPAVSAVEEDGDFNKQRPEQQLELQRTNKDREVSTLKALLDESDHEVRSLRLSLSGWIATAQTAEHKSQRLSDRLRGETTSLREQLQTSAEETRDLQQQLQDCKDEIKGLQDGIKSQGQNYSEDAEKAAKEKAEYEKELQQLSGEVEKLSGENEDLKKQREDAVRVAEGLNRKAREHEEQKNELSGKLETAEKAERTARTEVQTLQSEKLQTATEHERTVKEKAEEVRRLQQEVHNAKDATDANTREAETQHKTAIKEKEAEIRGLQQEAQNAKDAADANTRETERKHATTVTEKDEEIRRLQREAQYAKDAVDMNTREANRKHATTVRDRDQEIRRLQQEVQNAEDAADTNTREAERKHATTVKDKDEEIRRLQEEVPNAKDTVNLRNMETEKEQEKAAVEKAAKESAESQNTRIAAAQEDNEAGENALLLPQTSQANNPNTNADLQNSAIPEESHTSKPSGRETWTPRRLKRPAKPASGMLPSGPMIFGLADHAMNLSRQRNRTPRQHRNSHLSSIPQNRIPSITPNKDRRDFRQPFANILASLHPPKVSDTRTMRSSSLMTNGLPSIPEEGTPTSSPTKAMKDFRQPLADILASVKGPAKVSDTVSPAVLPAQTIQAPLGWTDEMTERVKSMDGDDIMLIGEVVKELDGLETSDDEALDRWVEKLSSDFRAEKK